MDAVDRPTMTNTDLPALDAAAARVGDRWTLLVVARLLDGACRFGELQSSLPGLAPNILTKRLRALEQEGLVVAEPYSRRPLRVAYRLTGSGAALADALRLLTQWGAEHPAAGRHAQPVRHRRCGTPVEAQWWCPTCAAVVGDDDASDLTWV
jgi:DNA-binding HxlR family transcriptional regulator